MVESEPEPDPASDPDEQTWIQAASKLTDSELAGRLALLAQDNDSLRLRVEILLALCHRARTAVDHDLLLQHLTWMLSRRPASHAARAACGKLALATDPALRELLAPLFQHAAGTATTPRELESLAAFHAIMEPERTKELLLRARSLDPGNEARWDDILRRQEAMATNEFVVMARSGRLGRGARSCGPLGDPRALSPDDVAKLERRLVDVPDDLDARRALIHVYTLRWLSSMSQKLPDAAAPARRAVLEHMTWLIDHAPGSRPAGEAGSLAHGLDPEARAMLGELWQRQVDARVDEADVLGNAANFFALHEPARALDLLKQARDLEPHEAGWSSKIAHHMTLKISRTNADERRAAAASAQAELEHAAGLIPAGSHVSDGIFCSLARSAFAAGDLPRAEEVARLLLDPGRWKPYYPAGDRLHTGHSVLGRIALGSGDVEGAKEHLLASAEVEGSPVLGSFGPSMSLARDLLLAGEREVVLDYLERCQRFWKRDEPRVWSEDIRAGRMPAFHFKLDELS